MTQNVFCKQWGDLKVGDIIVAYHKGFWKITKIERRFLEYKDLYWKHQVKQADGSSIIVEEKISTYKNNKEGDEINPLIHYVDFMSSTGKILKGKKEKACDYFFCKKAEKFIDSKIEDLEKIKKIIVENPWLTNP